MSCLVDSNTTYLTCLDLYINLDAIYIYIYISLIEIVERRYLKRSVNSAARTIVREVILCVIYKVWVEKISNCICGIVSRDFYIPN